MAKIRQMSGGASPVPGPRCMKRLIPDFRDIDSEAAAPQNESDVSAAPRVGALEEISLADPDELDEDTKEEEDVGQKQEVKEPV